MMIWVINGTKRYVTQFTYYKMNLLLKKWFQYQQYNTNGEIVEMKDAEIIELTNSSKMCFEAELVSLQKSKIKNYVI